MWLGLSFTGGFVSLEGVLLVYLLLERSYPGTGFREASVSIYTDL